MAMNHEELREHMLHRAVDLDYQGLSMLTGLDRRDCRRLGKEGKMPVPAELERWLRATREADRRRPSMTAWLERREGSNPPPWLSNHPWQPPGAVVLEEGPRRFT